MSRDESEERLLQNIYWPTKAEIARRRGTYQRHPIYPATAKGRALRHHDLEASAAITEMLEADLKGDEKAADRAASRVLRHTNASNLLSRDGRLGRG